MIYAVINQKGGVGKSTVAGVLLSGLTKRGFKTLAVDLDAQGNLSFSAGADTSCKKTSFELLTEKCSVSDLIQHTEQGDIIPSSRSLSGADAFITNTGKEYRLKEALEQIKNFYDYIILDTPPALGILTVNALTASDSVIIPAQADVYSLQGIAQLSETIELVKKYCNPDLKISGILLTRYSARAVLNRNISDMMQEQAKNLDTRLFKTSIREAVAVREAQISQKSIFDYAPKANITEDFQNFINELLEVSEHE